MIIVSSGTGTVTNINTTAPLSGGPITTSGAITTAMATNKLIGRSTAGTGVMEEITVGTGLSLTGGTLSSTGGATAAGNSTEIQYNNAGAFGANSNLKWDIPNNRAIIGTEAVADTNSRLVVIGKGQMTNTTFAVHNSTGTNNALVVRDDGRVGIGTNAPTAPLTIGNPLGASFTALNNTGTNSLSSRIDQNNITTINIRNATSGTNAYVANVFESTINGSPGQSRLLVAALSNATTNEYVGGEGNSAVIYYKHLGNTTDAKMKFAVTDATSVNNIKFEWISKLQSTANNDLVSGIGAVGSYTPIMTLLGNGSLLLGTTTDVATSILTINSTTKGVLLPRLTTTEINNIVSPATGLTVYNTTVNTLCFYNGSSWQKCNHSNL